MNRVLRLVLALGFASGCAIAQADAQIFNAAAGGPPSVSNVPASAFFVGLGGGYSSVDFGTQHAYAIGTSNTYSNGALVATGQAAGPADIPMDSVSTFAPSAQGGYFAHFGASNWLWGAKFAYSYLGATSTTRNVILPQYGSFNTGGVVTAFTGNALAGSVQTSVNHQMSFVLFGGRSFDNTFVYFGAGPSLSRLQTKLNGVVGFADINGTHMEITSQPTNFSASQWVYGGTFVVGTTLFLDRSWFLDFNYTYDITTSALMSFGAPFTNSDMTEVGTLSGTSSGRAITQTFKVTVNNAF